MGGFSGIRIDDSESACTAVQHLINLGHERIAMISGDPNEPQDFTVALRRREGYHSALEAAGLRVRRELEAHGTFSIEGGDDATVRLLGRRSLPTAIFAECDEMAFGALRALRRVGLRVPADVSLIGFDDHPMAQYFELTTISQDVWDQGCHIAQQLVRGWPDRVTYRRCNCAPPLAWSCEVPPLSSGRAGGLHHPGGLQAGTVAKITGDLNRRASNNLPVRHTRRERRDTRMKPTLKRGGSTMSQARAVLSASRRHKLFSIAALTGLFGLAVSMVPASASTASPRLGHTSGARFRSGPSGPAPSSRTSRPC